MNLTNQSYVIFIGNNNFLERYFRDEERLGKGERAAAHSARPRSKS